MFFHFASEDPSDIFDWTRKYLLQLETYQQGLTDENFKDASSNPI